MLIPFSNLGRRGTTLEFYNEVPEILEELKKIDTHVAAASRTQTPDLYVP
jgi:hypothetical protein